MLDPETPQQVLPSIVPLANVLVSAAALALIAFITIRRWRLEHYVSRLFVVDLMGIVMCAVLLAGALFQAGIMGAEMWTVIGTGGRLIVLSGFVALLLQHWEYIPVLDRSGVPAEVILQRAREEAAEILKDAARVAAAKIKAEAAGAKEMRVDVKRTADNTERIADSIETNGNGNGGA